MLKKLEEKKVETMKMMNDTKIPIMKSLYFPVDLMIKKTKKPIVFMKKYPIVWMNDDVLDVKHEKKKN